MPTWPASLPQSLNIGASGKPQDAVLRSQPDIGPTKTRQRFTAVAEEYSGDMLLYGDQLKRFEEFYRDEIGRGALAFDWTDPVTDALAQVRIKGYSKAGVGGNSDSNQRVWRLSLEIEVLP